MTNKSENIKTTSIGEIGEFGLIELLTKEVEINRASTILGIGDDGAVLDNLGKNTVVSTDLLVEGIHFDLSYMPLKHLGYKAVTVNLSDIYAMFAEPTHITVSIAISSKFSVESIEEIYDGILLACEKYNVDLIGGDTTSSTSGLIISITALGEIGDGNFVTRSGAKENDLICVSGNLGAAYLGLKLMEREKKIFLENPAIQPNLGGKTYIIERLLKPEARKDIIEWLKEKDILPTSMIDVSDGLSSEILHICKQSKVGARIYEEKIPIHSQTREMAEEFKIPDLTAALSGGEDYELLFTISQNDFDKIKDLEGIEIIGHILPENEGIHLMSAGGNLYPIEAQGWNPLKNN
ncbi:MAG: thiamine-phosphate kinase [Chitinophagaceae bacterium]|nr:thiamine-phosphate kinase [Chitinophagaceae bacterium]